MTDIFTLQVVFEEGETFVRCEGVPKAETARAEFLHGVLMSLSARMGDVPVDLIVAAEAGIEPAPDRPFTLGYEAAELLIGNLHEGFVDANDAYYDDAPPPDAEDFAEYNAAVADLCDDDDDDDFEDFAVMCMGIDQMLVLGKSYEATMVATAAEHLVELIKTKKAGGRLTRKECQTALDVLTEAVEQWQAEPYGE